MGYSMRQLVVVSTAMWVVLAMAMAMVGTSEGKRKSHFSPTSSPPPPPPPSSSSSGGKSSSSGKGHSGSGSTKSPPPSPSSSGKGHSGSGSTKSPPPSPSSSGKGHSGSGFTKSPPPSPSSSGKGHSDSGSTKSPPPSPSSKGKSSTSQKKKKKKNPDKDYYYPTSNIFDVMSFGAQGDGQTDDTEAFVATWQKACQVPSAVIEVPAYFIFMVRPLMFLGPCQHGLLFQIDGKIIPPSSESWISTNPLQWIGFSKVSNFALQGEGLVDGAGDCWWSLSCKAKAPNGRRLSKPCDSPTAIRFYGSYNVTVRDLAITNSPQTHLKFDNCINVEVANVSISSPNNSPNTDGIHIQNSQMVQIYDSSIQTGDDCISIQTGTSNLEIHHVNCGHGHGISIGGLGQGGSQACVSNISVHDVSIKNSLNGVRIKTWQGGSGSAKGITFSNINVENISNPIVIDQFYCDAHSCNNKSSSVHVSEVSYSNIKGTYWYGQPLRMACSDSSPCTKIALSHIQLVPIMNASKSALSPPFCWNAYGSIQTPTTPMVSCIQNGLPLSRNGQPLLDVDSC